MAEVVYFDLVGTLMHGTKPIGEQYADCARAFGAMPEPGRLELAFRRAMKAAPPLAFLGRSFDETEVLERAWWKTLVRQVVDEAGLSPALGGATFDDFFHALFDHFTTAAAWQLFPDTLPALEGLTARGTRVGLITNYDTRVFAVLEALGLSRYFSSVTIPAHVGVAKPAAEMFRRALANLGATASDARHVGDELDDDYEGALAAGLGAVLVDREDRFSDRPGLRRIRSLEALTRSE